MTMARILGIDLTSRGQASAAVVLNPDLDIINWGLYASDEELLALAQKHRPLVATDAPLSLPQGLDCLEETCSCRPEDARSGRAAERELARLDIGLFFTTKRSIIKEMVYRAILLKGVLTQIGLEVIEVYPYATRLRILGSTPKKSTLAGRRIIQKGLRKFIPKLPDPRQELLSHDLLDACLCAYTAYLWSRGRTLAVGDPQEGMISIPV